MEVKKIVGAVVAIMVAGIAILGAVQVGLIKGKPLPVEGDMMNASDAADDRTTEGSAELMDQTTDIDNSTEQTEDTNGTNDEAAV